MGGREKMVFMLEAEVWRETRQVPSLIPHDQGNEFTPGSQGLCCLSVPHPSPLKAARRGSSV